MITKTVTSGQRSAQATISEETRFIFSDKWNFFHVQNMGAGNVYISMVAGKAGGDDGVITVLPGCSACSSHSFPANSVYITADNATDKVEVVGSNSAVSPFKSGSSGGGGSSYTLPIAAADTLGGIKPDGTTITVNNETGVASAAGSSYSLPAASAETLGGVKVGTGLSVTAEGVLLVSGGGITQTLLFNGATNTTDVYTLSAAYTGFKFLIIGAIYSADELFNAIINCADIRATPDYSKRNSLYVGGNRLIAVNTNGVNFKTPAAFSYCKIYGVN